MLVIDELILFFFEIAVKRGTSTSTSSIIRTGLMHKKPLGVSFQTVNGELIHPQLINIPSESTSLFQKEFYRIAING